MEPKRSAAERIVFCVDACRRDRLVRVVETFALTKQAINADTEFAVVALRDAEPAWAQRFTKNAAEVSAALATIAAESAEAPDFDLSTLFELVRDEIEPPNPECKVEPAASVVRVILMYARSDCVPTMKRTEVYDALSRRPRFALDVLYAHDGDCDEHRCAEIFDALQALDLGCSYVFETTSEPDALLECGAKLLAHPLQRCAQENSCYALPR